MAPQRRMPSLSLTVLYASMSHSPAAADLHEHFIARLADHHVEGAQAPEPGQRGPRLPCFVHPRILSRPAGAVSPNLSGQGCTAGEPRDPRAAVQMAVSKIKSTHTVHDALLSVLLVRLMWRCWRGSSCHPPTRWRAFGLKRRSGGCGRHTAPHYPSSWVRHTTSIAYSSGNLFKRRNTHGLLPLPAIALHAVVDFPFMTVFAIHVFILPLPRAVWQPPRRSR